MSHVVGIQVDVKDEAALIKAADKVDLIDVRTKNWDWYGKWVNDYSADDAAYKNGISVEDYGKCEWALVQKDSPLGKAEIAARAQGRRLTHEEAQAIRAKANVNPYSIGVMKNPAGGFRLAYDFWSGGYGLKAKIGEGANKLRQHYAVQAATNVAVKQGHKIISELEMPNGDIKLKVMIPAKTKFTLG